MNWPEIVAVVPAPRMVETNVRAYLAGEVAESTPRDSATVVLLRSGTTGPEVYLQQRASTMVVSAGRFVFPGGLVDDRDYDAAVPWAGPSAEDWARRLGTTADVARAIVTAAVRETFEESGVLLAATSEGVPVRQEPGWDSVRQDLVDRSVSFGEFLAQRSLVLRSDLLREVTRWITPAWARRRFDTRFFAATIPSGQQPSANHESDVELWAGLDDVIARAASGELDLMHPTVATLRTLVGPPEVEGILDLHRDAGANEFHLVPRPDDSYAVYTSGPGGVAYAYSIGAPPPQQG